MRSRRIPIAAAALEVRENSRRRSHALLKYCTARSCFSAAALDPNVPKFFRFPVFASFFRE